jgi:hypothetical protein
MRKLVMAWAAIAALLPAIVSGHAQAASGPFANMAGSWTGGGTLTMSDGQSERLRCRASYGVADDGRNLRLNLHCASDSYDFNLAGDVQYQRGAIAGSWSESSHNAAGTLSGRADGNRIEAVARGDNFSASLALTTGPGRQSVVIQPQGTDVRTVAVRLNKR